MLECEYLDRRKEELLKELEEIQRRQTQIRGEETQKSLLSSVSAPRMMTIKEAAKASHLAENYLRYLCKTGSIVFVKAGNKYLINYEKLLAFLNGCDGQEMK